MNANGRPSSDEPVRILIADDDDVCREILLDTIRWSGVEVVLVGDGLEALTQLGLRAFDILITDLNMPRMDGLTLLKKAREQYPDLLTIIITGYGSLESAIEAVRLGAYDYLQKPFKIEEMTVTAKNAIEKVRILREKSELLQEIEVLHGQLKSMRQGNVAERGGDGGFGERSNSLCLFPDRALPLFMIDRPPRDVSGMIDALRNLKELRAEGLLSEHEFARLKKRIIDDLDPGKP
jgi:CheY-like chemotaxis protein